MRILSLNLNGIRAAARKDFFPWLQKQQADIVCLQETRAHTDQLSSDPFFPKGYQHYYISAQKKGYSGVALFCKQQPDDIKCELGFEPADSEGRYVQVRFGKLIIACIYLPSGSSGEHRQEQKWVFLDKYYKILHKQFNDQHEYIICGDFNIAHQKIDIKNWQANQKSSGFLPEERAWMDKVLDLGFVDTFRKLHPRKEEYTWWSHRGNAFANNVGWRIDYQLATPKTAQQLTKTTVVREPKFSDHAPLIFDYNITI